MNWYIPPDDLFLSGNDAHVWRADLEPDEFFPDTFLEILSPDEKERAQKFRFEKDRRRFISARGILRSLIGRYLDIKPGEISFQYSEFGKPGIANNNSLRFNISHAQNQALFAFTTKYNIGVDIEFVNPGIEIQDIASKFFSKNEITKLLALPAEQQPAGFFNCWTRKESFIKAVGEGLSFPLDKFEVSLEPGQPAKLLATDWNPGDVLKWSLYSISPGINFVGSLAIEGLVENVKFWDWQKS